MIMFNNIKFASGFDNDQVWCVAGYTMEGIPSGFFYRDKNGPSMSVEYDITPESNYMMLLTAYKKAEAIHNLEEGHIPIFNLQAKNTDVIECFNWIEIPKNNDFTPASNYDIKLSKTIVSGTSSEFVLLEPFAIQLRFNNKIILLGTDPTMLVEIMSKIISIIDSKDLMNINTETLVKSYYDNTKMGEHKESISVNCLMIDVKIIDVRNTQFYRPETKPVDVVACTPIFETDMDEDYRPKYIRESAAKSLTFFDEMKRVTDGLDITTYYYVSNIKPENNTFVFTPKNVCNNEASATPFKLMTIRSVNGKHSANVVLDQESFDRVYNMNDSFSLCFADPRFGVVYFNSENVRLFDGDVVTP